MTTKDNISFFACENWEEDLFKDSFKDFNNSFIPDNLTIHNVSKAKDANVISIFIYSQVTKEVLDKLPNLKLIVTRSTGFDHIDINECKRRDITVCNVPTYGEDTVAEHTFALILAISRKIVPCVLNFKKQGFNLTGLRGFDLKGKKIGIIGGGNIGQNVARIAKGFGMDVSVFDINKNKDLANNIGFKYVTMDKLIKKSDIISLHVPYNKYTHHLINKETIDMMKKGVVIINTARGGVIDSSALIYGLNKKIISYAGLDVLEEECAIKEEKELLSKKISCSKDRISDNQILVDKDNVLITPHNAFNSKEAIQRINNTTIQNVLKHYLNKTINKVF